MRITWLLEDTTQIWGGVKVALEDANWLHARGHEVTVLSRSGPPDWMELECGFYQVRDFHPDNLPDADILIGTFWSTVPWIASAGLQKGVPVHYCQGYEGDALENTTLRDRIEATYRLPGIRHITISSNLTKLLQGRFGIEATQIIYAVDHAVHYPGAERSSSEPLRVGIVGPYAVSWKGLPTGYEACRLAHQAGQPLVLVRASNIEPSPQERETSFPVEWHQRLTPKQMGDYYRSLDVFLGTSIGPQEGFFLPAVEAMACGVPSVLTDIPCFRSHGKGDGQDHYALFVPPEDPTAMAEALVVAGRVAEVRASLRSEGMATASRYTRDKHGEALETVLEQFVRKAVGSSPPTQEVTGQPALGPEKAVETLADCLLQEALRSEAAGSPELAQRLLGAASCLAPEDFSLRKRLARARTDTGDHEGALAIYEEIETRWEENVDVHLGRGVCLHRLGRFDEAARAFQAAIAIGAQTVDTFNRLGVVLFQAGDCDGARRSFEQALELEPDNTDAKANLEAILVS